MALRKSWKSKREEEEPWEPEKLRKKAESQSNFFVLFAFASWPAIPSGFLLVPFQEGV